MALFGLFFTLVFAFVFSKWIARPILHLAGAVQRVEETKDFSIRTEKTSDDELGVLVDSFNRMLERIEIRDSELDAHRVNLEGMVLDRTSDLSAAMVQLRAAKELAEEAVNAKSAFLANMSHEIRTPMSELPASVYVLTGDEIRRAGHSSIPEALRMVPGMFVSRWTTSQWDVTARGFGSGLALTNSAYLNQLLVMVDGVVVYSPLFAGMQWSVQDVLIEDVDRIEIVRGPGGVLWGSNAVHGVVHIITKSSEDTTGVLVSYRYGREDIHGGWRVGGRINENLTYRFWGKGANYETLSNPFGDFDYDYRMRSVGTRFDWKGEKRSFSFLGRTFWGKFGQLGYDLTTFDPIQVEDRREGSQILVSTTDEETGGRWQAWYSRNSQDLPTLGDVAIDTYDLEYQRPFELDDHNTLSVGVGYRRTYSKLYGDDPFWYDFDPHKVGQDNFRLFATDTIKVPSINSTLTVGVAAEHNEFTDFEIQPTIRYSWAPTESWVVWAGYSRAVRTPSLEERTLTSDSYYAGNMDFRSETLRAYELGVRGMPTEWMSVDVAVYMNDYDHLHYEDPNNPDVWAFHLTNEADGEAFGGELALDFQATEDLKLRTGFGYEEGDFDATDGTDLGTSEQSPKYQVNARAYYNLTKSWEIDSGFYRVDGLGDGRSGAEYERVDARLGWNPGEDFRFYVGVQDAFNRTRSEFDEFDNARRSIFVGFSFEH